MATIGSSRASTRLGPPRKSPRCSAPDADGTVVSADIDLPQSTTPPPTSALGAGPQNPIILLARCTAGALLYWLVCWFGCCNNFHPPWVAERVSTTTLEQEKTALRTRARVALLVRCSAGAILCWAVYWFGCCVNLCSLPHSCYPICCLLHSAPSLPTPTSRHLPLPPSYATLPHCSADACATVGSSAGAASILPHAATPAHWLCYPPPEPLRSLAPPPRCHARLGAPRLLLCWCVPLLVHVHSMPWIDWTESPRGHHPRSPSMGDGTGSARGRWTQPL